MDMTRICSMTVLIMHFYYYCHEGFAHVGYTHEFIDRVMINITSTGIFKTVWVSKCIILVLLAVSLLGVSVRKV